MQDLQIPAGLRKEPDFSSEESVLGWENELINFFSENYRLFTPYPNYFKTRCYEFRILRQLLNNYFDLNNKYDSILEIGCGFGYKSLLLLPYCKKVFGVDIPQKYKACIMSEFETSVDLAKFLLNEKFGIKRIVFNSFWPDKFNFENDSQPMIFSEYVLEHIPELTPAFREMYRVLSKDGVMIHVVPNTAVTVLQYVNANVNFSPLTLFTITKSYLARLFRRSNSSCHIRLNGTVVPQCHSEFIKDYSKQIEVYSLENYLFPMLDAGFKIEKIVSTREYNNVIIARK